MCGYVFHYDMFKYCIDSTKHIRIFHMWTTDQCFLLQQEYIHTCDIFEYWYSRIVVSHLCMHDAWVRYIDVINILLSELWCFLYHLFTRLESSNASRQSTGELDSRHANQCDCHYDVMLIQKQEIDIKNIIFFVMERWY